MKKLKDTKFAKWLKDHQIELLVWGGAGVCVGCGAYFGYSIGKMVGEKNGIDHVCNYQELCAKNDLWYHVCNAKTKNILAGNPIMFNSEEVASHPSVISFSPNEKLRIMKDILELGLDTKVSPDAPAMDPETLVHRIDVWTLHPDA